MEHSIDRDKVIKAYEICDNNEDGIVCKNCPYKEDKWNGAWEDETGITCFQTLHADVLAVLKDQEHKDRMFHALEEDWKRLKELLKEQEAVEPNVSSAEQRCGNCNKVIEMDGWQSCPWCGKRIDWKGWWKKNGTRNQDS